jgi:integrase
LICKDIFLAKSSSDPLDGPSGDQWSFLLSSIPSYLWLSRHGLYYARVVIPAPLRDRFPNNKREIRRSLKTGNRREAMKRARAVLVELDHMFQQLVVSADAVAIDRSDATPRSQLWQVGKLIPARNTLAAAPDTLPLAQSAPEPRSNDLTITEVAERYLADKAARGLREKTLHEYRASLMLVAQALDDMPLLAVTRDHARDFRGKLMRLPSNMTKLYPGKTVLQVLEAKDLEQQPRMDTRTVNKTLGRFSGLCAWAVADDLIPKNPATGLEINTDRRPDEEAEPFEHHELQAIFNGYIYSGSIPSRTKVYPYQFWLPLLGLYTGARINELCQLYLSDIKQVDDFWVFSILDDEKDKQLKRATSRRLVPVHPALTKLGLIDYVTLLRNAGHKRLFLELPKRRDGYGQVASKWFARYRQRINIDKPFHAFRHTVATHLKRMGHQEERVAEMLGHIRGRTESFRRYGKAYGPAALIEVIDSLTFDISLDHVNFSAFVARAGTSLLSLPHLEGTDT